MLIVGGVILLGRAFPTMSGATSFFIYAVCCLISLYLLRQRIVGIGLGAVLILVVSYVSSFYDGGDTLVQKRSFFGVKRVLYDAHADRSLLIHGRIIHGLQNRAPDKENVPLAYYAENGPLGQVIGAFGAEPINIGVVGLGAGSLAAYASHARQMVFYEIDPDVEVMARDPRYFTFMKHCGDRCQVILGDGRLQLQHAPAENFGLLVLDAFSSDSVPVHLLSAEAVSLYLSKLSANGVLMFNASNKFLHIDAVIAAVADSLHLPAYVKRERDISPSEKARGRFRSTWVMIPKNPTHQPPEGYLPLTKDLNIAPWTDRYSNLFSVIRW